jgi:hypothetical protein
MAEALRFTLPAASNQRAGHHQHDIQPAYIASNQLEEKYSTYLWHRTSSKFNMMLELPVASN